MDIFNLDNINEFKHSVTMISKDVTVYKPSGFHGSLLDIINIATDIKNVDIIKEQRYFVSQSLLHPRYKTEHGYQSWSGLQVIDLDIKNEEAARILKFELAKVLFKYNQFPLILTSASGTGLHIYIFVKPNVRSNEEYLDNFEASASLVWHACILTHDKYWNDTTLSTRVKLDMHPVKNLSSRKENKDGTLSESKMLDTSTAKPWQPIIIGYDPEPEINPNFKIEFPLGISDRIYDIELSQQFKAMFDRYRGRYDGSDSMTDLDVLGVQLPNLDKIVPRNYNNTARYRLAYTLANLYDLRVKDDKFRFIMTCYLKMCSGNPKFHQEQKGFEAVLHSAVQRQIQGMSPIIAWSINELKSIHGVEIELSNPEALLQPTGNDAVSELNAIEDVQMPSELDIKYHLEAVLTKGVYLSQATNDLLGHLKVPGSKMLMVAEPGTGKTVFATNLMKAYSTLKLRVTVVVPFVSIIESKFKTLPTTGSDAIDCQFIYGKHQYVMDGAPHCVMTFDKFSRLPSTTIDTIADIVIIDESHLLLMSSYRRTIPADVINNVRDIKTPTVVMTGTPIAEHLYIDFTYRVKFLRERMTDKLFNLIVCESPQDKFVQAIIHVSNAIKSGRSVIFPTNEGNSYVEKIVHAVQEMIQRPVDFAYYKKENQHQSFMFDVNHTQTLGSIELLFCSTYLSVGVDINDLGSFDIVYTEDFTAHEIEQFNNRLRKVDIASYMFISRNFGHGGFRRSLTSSKLPNLRIANLRSMELEDLIQLHSVQKSGDNIALFDFVKVHMNKPYISMNADEPTLHATCYSLYTFENIWRKWSTQVPVMMQILRGFGYTINVIDSELLDTDETERVLASAKEGFRLHADIAKDDLIFLLKLIENRDFYDVLMYTNKVTLLNGQTQSFRPTEHRLFITVSNVPIAFRLIQGLRLLNKYYSRWTIQDIWSSDESLAKLEQVVQTVELLDMMSNDRLSTANTQAMQYIVQVLFEGRRTIEINKEGINIHLMHVSSIYKDLYDLRSPEIMQKIHGISYSMLNRLAKQMTRRRKGMPNVWELKTLPPFDSNEILMTKANQELVMSMFRQTLFEQNDNMKSNTLVDNFMSSSSHIDARSVYSQTLNITESMNRLQEFTIEPKLSDALRRSLASYLSAMDFEYDFIESILTELINRGEFKNPFKTVNDIAMSMVH